MIPPAGATAYRDDWRRFERERHVLIAQMAATIAAGLASRPSSVGPAGGYHYAMGGEIIEKAVDLARRILERIEEGR